MEFCVSMTHLAMFKDTAWGKRCPIFEEFERFLERTLK